MLHLRGPEDLFVGLQKSGQTTYICLHSLKYIFGCATELFIYLYVIYLFLERGEAGEKEMSVCGCLSCAPCCLDEWNVYVLGCGTSMQPGFPTILGGGCSAISLRLLLWLCEQASRIHHASLWTEVLHFIFVTRVL